MNVIYKKSQNNDDSRYCFNFHDYSCSENNKKMKINNGFGRSDYSSNNMNVLKIDSTTPRIKSIIDFMDNRKIDYVVDYRNKNVVIDINTYMPSNKKNLLVRKKEFADDIFTVLDSKIVYIKSGTYGHTFMGYFCDKQKNINFKYAIKIVAYQKKEKFGDIYNDNRPENAEINMLKLLSFFVVMKRTPHLILPISSFNVSIEHIIRFMEKNNNKEKKYVEFLENYKKGMFHNNVSILLSEWADKGDLLDYIRKNANSMTLIEWKVILFQIISTLALIQHIYPAFRHNDLKANNILLSSVDNPNPIKYNINNKVYVVPSVKLSIRIWDFDFACIPGLINNMKVVSTWTKNINISQSEHKYYDLHYLLNTLAFCGFYPGFMSNDNMIPVDVKRFIKRIIPSKYRSYRCEHVKDEKHSKNSKRTKESKKEKDVSCDICYKNVHHKGRLLVNDEYVTPLDIIEKDDFFVDFRQ